MNDATKTPDILYFVNFVVLDRVATIAGWDTVRHVSHGAGRVDKQPVLSIWSNYWKLKDKTQQ